jgi:hypothetical protein
VNGIATAVAIGRFISSARASVGQWNTVAADGTKSPKKPEERAEPLGDAVGKELEAVGVPKCGIKVEEISANGQLDFVPWKITLNKKEFAKPEATNDPTTTTPDKTACMQSIAGTVYHEARHAEQWFKMARIEAGRGKTAEEIHTQLGVELNTCKAAKANPLGNGKDPATPEEQQAQTWHESVYQPSATGPTTNNPVRHQIYAEKKRLAAELEPVREEYTKKIKTLEEVYEKVKEKRKEIKTLEESIQKLLDERNAQIQPTNESVASLNKARKARDDLKDTRDDRKEELGLTDQLLASKRETLDRAIKTCDDAHAAYQAPPAPAATPKAGSSPASPAPDPLLTAWQKAYNEVYLPARKDWDAVSAMRTKAQDGLTKAEADLQAANTACQAAYAAYLEQKDKYDAADTDWNDEKAKLEPLNKELDELRAKAITAKSEYDTAKAKYDPVYVQYKAAFQKYLDLPEEQDARAVGDQVKAAYNAPAPPPTK